MLNVWRGRGRIFAECSECGSYGTAVVQPKRRMSPVVQDALEKHEAHMLRLRTSFTSAGREIAKQIREGSMQRKDGAKKITDMQVNFIGQIRLAEARLPKPDGEIVEYVDACPWCGHQTQVDVQILDEKLTEPDFVLARPVKAFLDKQMASLKTAAKGK